MPEPGHPRLLTYADYAALPDDGNRYQLLEGELIMTPSPNASCWGGSREIFIGLVRFVRLHRQGDVFAAPLDVTLSDRIVLQLGAFRGFEFRLSVVPLP